MWYDDFTQTSDKEVAELLQHLAHERRVEKVIESKPELYHEVLTHDG